MELGRGIHEIFEDGLIVGGGSRDPRIFLVPCDEARAPIPLADYSDQGSGFSFYALDVSPEHTYLTVASRPIYESGGQPQGRVAFPSLVRVYLVRETEAGSHSLRRHPFFVYETSGVSDLLIEDDGTLWLACGDGQLKAYSINQNLDEPASICLRAHQGWVLAMVRAGAGRLATFGIDGILNVWEPASGRKISVLENVATPPLGALMSLAWDEGTNAVYCGSGTGELHRLSVPTGDHITHQAHEGGIAAVTVHPEIGQVISGGVNDSTLRVANPDSLAEIARVSVGAAVHGLVPLPGRKLACLDGGNRVTVWRLDGGPSCVGIRATVEARSWVGPNVASRAAARRQAEAGERTAAHRSFEEAMKRHDLDEAGQAVGRLRRLEAGGQALAAEAALCRERGKLLDEFMVWKAMEEAEGEGEAMPNSARYLQAENLTLLLEPELAAERFEALGHYRDAS